MARENRRLHVPGFHALLREAAGNGAFIVWRKTAKKRMMAKLRAIKAELRSPDARAGGGCRCVAAEGRGRAITNITPFRETWIGWAFSGSGCGRLWRLVLSRRSQRGSALGIG